MKNPTHMDCRAVTMNSDDAFVLWRIQNRYRRAKTRRDGRMWYVERRRDLADAIGMSLDRLDRSLARLREKGLIQTMRGPDRIRGLLNALWYRLVDTCQILLWGEKPHEEDHHEKEGEVKQEDKERVGEALMQGHVLEEEKMPDPEDVKDAGSMEEAWRILMRKHRGRVFHTGWTRKERAVAKQILKRVPKGAALPVIATTVARWNEFRDFAGKGYGIKTPSRPNIVILGYFTQTAVDFFSRQNPKAFEKYFGKAS